METKSENINIEEIVKKPRKPRMSTVVSKAVLLKQMSDADILSKQTEVVEVVVEKTPTTIIPETDTVNGESKPVKVKKEKKLSASREVKHDITPLSSAMHTPPASPLLRPEAIDVVPTVCEANGIVGECALCSVSFKSSVLFARHPNTLKHKLAKNKADHIKKESK